MKNLFLLVFLLATIACGNRTEEETAKLPPETQNGANTFGVTILGKIYVPRDPKGFSTLPNGKGMTFWGAPDNYSYNELEVVDGASDAGFRMVIHIQKLQELAREFTICPIAIFKTVLIVSPQLIFSSKFGIVTSKTMLTMVLLKIKEKLLLNDLMEV